MKRSAFSLVELLVVITIMVVLLSLLTPAMEQAVYQAELATCAANLDAMGTGLAGYAMENTRRFFPTIRWSSQFLRDPESFGGHDLRKTYGSHVPADMWADPLSGNVEFDEAS